MYSKSWRGPGSQAPGVCETGFRKQHSKPRDASCVHTVKKSPVPPSLTLGRSPPWGGTEPLDKYLKTQNPSFRVSIYIPHGQIWLCLWPSSGQPSFSCSHLCTINLTYRQNTHYAFLLQEDMHVFVRNLPRNLGYFSRFSFFGNSWFGLAPQTDDPRGIIHMSF